MILRGCQFNSSLAFSFFANNSGGSPTLLSENTIGISQPVTSLTTSTTSKTEYPLPEERFIGYFHY